MSETPTPGNYPAFVRLFMVRPRLFWSAVCGIATSMLLTGLPNLHTVTRLIIGWNVGALLYIVLASHMMFSSTHERMRSRALTQDEGRIVILGFVIGAALMSLGAIVAELAVARDFQDTHRYAHIGLAVLTILTTWAFTQFMFALHYAHDYYAAEARGATGGLDFPGCHTPDYADFLYFACVIGTSGQTADVSFTSRSMRRTGLVHCVLAFLFNTTLLALTINIASGLF